MHYTHRQTHMLNHYQCVQCVHVWWSWCCHYACPWFVAGKSTRNRQPCCEQSWLLPKEAIKEKLTITAYIYFYCILHGLCIEVMYTPSGMAGSHHFQTYRRSNHSENPSLTCRVDLETYNLVYTQSLHTTSKNKQIGILYTIFCHAELNSNTRCSIQDDTHNEKGSLSY